MKSNREDFRFRAINIKTVHAHAEICSQIAKSYSTSIFLKSQTKENLEECVSTIPRRGLTKKRANNDIKWEETDCET